MSLSPQYLDPDPERFDGLTLSEALQLCVKRSAELSLVDTDFIVKLTRRSLKKGLPSDEIVRLRTLVVNLRLAALKREFDAAGPVDS